MLLQVVHLFRCRIVGGVDNLTLQDRRRIGLSDRNATVGVAGLHVLLVGRVWIEVRGHLLELLRRLRDFIGAIREDRLNRLIGTEIGGQLFRLGRPHDDVGLTHLVDRLQGHAVLSRDLDHSGGAAILDRTNVDFDGFARFHEFFQFLA